MTPYGDDPPEMNTTDPGADPVLAGFLHEMRTLADVAAPPTSDELEALFTSSLPLAQRGRPDRRRVPVVRPLLTPLLAAAAVVALLVLGAATHQLPAPAQRLISNVVNSVTPFHIDPEEHPVAPAPSRHPDRLHPGAQRADHGTRFTSPRGPVAPGAAAPTAPVPNRSAAPPAGHPTSAAPGRSGTAPSGKALGHGAPHGTPQGKPQGTPHVPSHGAAHTAGRSSAPGQVGRTGSHGGGRPAPPSPVPSVSASAGPHGKGHGYGAGNGKGHATDVADALRQYPNLIKAISRLNLRSH
jgi:hypothetical protein